MSFFKKSYVRNTKDSPEVLREKGTLVAARVIKITKYSSGKYEVIAEYEGKQYKNSAKELSTGTRIGSEINLYLDRVDTDGDYFLEI